MIRTATLLICSLLLGPLAKADELSQSTRLGIDSIVTHGITHGYYPCASVAVGNSKGLLYAKCYGTIDGVNALGPEHIFDIASCTKIVATTSAIMRLYEENKIELEKSVGHYIDIYRGTAVDGIKIADLLTHTSGLRFFSAYTLVMRNSTGGPYTSPKQSVAYPTPVDRGVWLCAKPEYNTSLIDSVAHKGWRQIAQRLYINPSIDKHINEAIVTSYSPSLVGKYLYTDANMVVLRQIIETISTLPFEQFVGQILRLAGMSNSGFAPLEWCDERNIVPTEIDCLMQRGQILGQPHDELAAMARGQAEGNAGLFTTATDLGRYATMMLKGGSIDGKHIFKPKTIALFTSQPLKVHGINRGYGFDCSGPSSALYGGYGHTGYTGTIIWIEPSEELYMVFLSNRVYPTRTNTGLSESSLRTKLWQYIKTNAPK